MVSHRQIIVLVLAVGLFGAFVVFSRSIKHGGMKAVDFATTVRLQNHIPPRFDELMADGAVFADPFVSSFLVFVTSGYVLLKYRGRKKLLGFLIPVAFVALTVIEFYGKNFVPHPGPPFFMVKHPTTIFPEFTVIQPFSYPSGHAARITFLALVLFGLTTIRQCSNVTMLKKHWIQTAVISTILVAYLVFVAVSRIYLGHHWLSDIIGGFLLGASCALFPLGIF
ncbi:phosphatase PAP2 family protein [Patescibacteria group bacterium]|nr:phosphatase PAP2 family protein [Patescibacteria group bacterium]